MQYEKIIKEIKAESTLAHEHRAQVHNDDKASSFKIGFLVNVGKPKTLAYERIV